MKRAVVTTSFGAVLAFLSALILCWAVPTVADAEERTDYVEGEVIVVFNYDVTLEEKQAVLGLDGVLSLELIDEAWDSTGFDYDEWCLLRHGDSVLTEKVVAELGGMDGVQYAYPNPFWGHSVGGNLVKDLEGLHIDAGVLNVRFFDGASSDEMLKIFESVGAKSWEDVETPYIGWKWRVNLDGSMSIAHAISKLKGNPLVERAEPAYLLWEEGVPQNREYFITFDSEAFRDESEALLEGISSEFSLKYELNSGAVVYYVRLKDDADIEAVLKDLDSREDVKSVVDNAGYGHVIGSRLVDFVEGVDSEAGSLMIYLDFGSTKDDAAATLEDLKIEGVSEVGSKNGEWTCFLVNFSGATVAEAMATADSSPNVLLSHPNWLYESDGAFQEESEGGFSVDDPLIENQLHLAYSNAYYAWDISKTLGSVKVAVIDSGVRSTHEDLAEVLDMANARNLSGDDASISDVSARTNHGTQVAGVIGAQVNNGKGVSGVSYGATIVPINVMRQNSGGNFVAYSENIAQAVSYAAGVDGVRVINISLGRLYDGSLSDDDLAVESAFDAAVDDGVVVVCSAGNENSNSSHFPSDLESCISVVSLSAQNERSEFSNYGSGTDISATGEFILTTDADSDSDYETVTGTSFAAPIVSGIVSLLLAEDPALTVEEVKAILYATATDLGVPGFDSETAHGAVDALKALQCLTFDAVELGGTSTHDTAAMQASYAFPDGSEGVVVVGRENWTDALVATGLAGALDYPILLTEKTYLPQATESCIDDLGCSNVIIVGGPAVVTDEVAADLGAAASCTPARIYGNNSYDTARAVFDYGMQNSLWAGDMVFVASAVSFYDPLSLSPLTYSLKEPLLLANATSDDLAAADLSRIESAGFDSAVIAGGSSVVSNATAAEIEEIMGTSNVTRLWGDSLYDTSIAIAEWAVENNYAEWDGVAFSSSAALSYSDALCGSAVQGKEGSVLLMVFDSGPDWGRSCLPVLKENAGAIESLKFFGGTAVIQRDLRFDLIAAAL